MKAIQMKQFGGPDVLTYTDVAEPAPGAGEVRVALAVAGVNPSDAYIRAGGYAFYTPQMPCTPGFDGAGVIDAIGEGVSGLETGGRVFVAGLLSRRITGTYAQIVVCDAACVHPLPDKVPFEEGAALGVPALTAHRALFQRGRLKPGETVLIHGASGAVGNIAVQMASGMGAIVIGTAGSEAGKELVRQSGADFVTDHASAANLGEILALTGGKGPDLIIECLANKNLATDLQLIARFGRIVVVGSRGSLDFNPRQIMAKEADVLGLALWNAGKDEYRQSLAYIAAMLKAGTLHPRIGTVFPLREARRAHEQILEKAGNGKMLLRIGTV